VNSENHYEILVEERSAEEFLNVLLPRIAPKKRFEIHSYSGKRDLLRKLPNRLNGYSLRLSTDSNLRIIVLLDRHKEDCSKVKGQIESEFKAAGIPTKSASNDWRGASRIAIEELEAWYFGDWAAVCSAYPRLDPNVHNKARYRDPDSIKGGTWEAFERELKRAGYYGGGLNKVQAARDVASHIVAERSSSRSFRVFVDLFSSYSEAANAQLSR
jgi:hypothetical protein